MGKVDWDKRFMDLAEYYSTWSKDKNRGVGAVIVNKDGIDIVKGYNGFPKGVNDEVEERYFYPLKDFWTIHAEQNAIYKASREGISINGCTLYCTYFPCANCAKAIIQSGIIKIISPQPDMTHKTWGETWKISLEMLTECGVEIKFI